MTKDPKKAGECYVGIPLVEFWFRDLEPAIRAAHPTLPQRVFNAMYAELKKGPFIKKSERQIPVYRQSCHGTRAQNVEDAACMAWIAAIAQEPELGLSIHAWDKWLDWPAYMKQLDETAREEVRLERERAKTLRLY
jgi:hypothetical protein